MVFPRSLTNSSDKVKLTNRATTYSVTVPPTNSDFSNVAIAAHTHSVDDIISSMGTSKTDGLSKNEAHRRLEQHGENLLKGRAGVSAWRVLGGQLGQLIHICLVFRKFT